MRKYSDLLRAIVFGLVAFGIYELKAAPPAEGEAVSSYIEQ